MKILTTLLAIVVSIFFAGNSFSGESSALMKALTSPQMGMYTGDQGAWIIIAQPRDGASTVRNVEALDTLYLFSDQTKDSLEQYLIFEMDKTNSDLPILRYRLDLDAFMSLAQFDPTGLPPIDFQLAWKLVKKAFGEDFPSAQENTLTVASVSVIHVLEWPYLTLLGFNVKEVDDPSERCWEYIYNTDTKQVEKSDFVPPCWFDMDFEGVYCDVYEDSTICQIPLP